MTSNNNNIAKVEVPVLSDYFARLTPECRILKAECELVVMGIFVYPSSKEIVVWDDNYSTYEKSRGNLIDVMLTDGFHFRKVFLCPKKSLENQVLTKKLYVGKKVKLHHCSLNIDETNKECVFIAVHDLEVLGDGTFPDTDCLNPDPRYANLQQFSRNFLPLLENKITFFDIWFNNIPRWPPEELFAKATISDETIMQAVTGGTSLKELFYNQPSTQSPVTPLVIRVVAKGNLVNVQTDRETRCPFNSLFKVVDASGMCTMILFNAANIMYNRINEGSLLYITDYHVKLKDSTAICGSDAIINSKCKYEATFAMEILIKPSILKNQNNIATIPIKVVDGNTSLERKIAKYLPLPAYNFLKLDSFNSQISGLVDVTGVVIGISRFVRLRQKNYQLLVFRWIEIVRMDESQTVVPIYFAIHQQVADHVNLKLGELIAVTNLRCHQWNQSNGYLESTQMSQIIGYSDRNYALLSRQPEYVNSFKMALSQEYVDRLLGQFGWLGGRYSLIKTPEYNGETPFLPITPPENWRKEIHSLACCEIKPILTCGRIVKVTLLTAAGISQQSRSIYWLPDILYKSANMVEPMTEFYGSERPHINTFPVFYDVNTYINKLESMQFPPMDIDEWFDKQQRKSHPRYKEGQTPISIPVPFLSIYLQSLSGNAMFICCFPICFAVKDIENANLKQLLSLQTGAQYFGSKLVNLEKHRSRGKLQSDTLGLKLKLGAEEIFKEEVVCLLEVCRIESDVHPEIILRKVYWKDES